MTEPRTPDAERDSLEGLLSSDGWKVYEEAMRTRWSPAQYEADIRHAMAECPQGEDVTPIVGQINATYAGMRNMLQWPHDRIRTLKGGRTKPTADIFAMFRRTPRTR